MRRLVACHSKCLIVPYRNSNHKVVLVRPRQYWLYHQQPLASHFNKKLFPLLINISGYNADSFVMWAKSPWEYSHPLFVYRKPTDHHCSPLCLACWSNTTIHLPVITQTQLRWERGGGRLYIELQCRPHNNNKITEVVSSYQKEKLDTRQTWYPWQTSWGCSSPFWRC